MLDAATIYVPTGSVWYSATGVTNSAEILQDGRELDKESSEKICTFEVNGIDCGIGEGPGAEEYGGGLE